MGRQGEPFSPVPEHFRDGAPGTALNHAMALRQFGHAEDSARVRHGQAFLRDLHHNPATGAHAWQLQWTDRRKTVDAIDLQAHAAARKAMDCA